MKRAVNRGRRRRERRGVVLVLCVVSLTMIIAFMALAVDLGLLALARTQCQNAADVASMAGARTLNGNTANSANNNYASVSPNASTAVAKDSVLGIAVGSSQLSLQIGRYAYNSTDKQFEGQFPGPSTQNYSLVQATVTANVASQLPFAKVLNYSGGSIQTTSTAVHRPRDISIVLDFSGSMRLSTLYNTYYFTGDSSGNNPDTLVPTWGHYSSASANMVATSFTTPYDAGNITSTSSDGRPPMMTDFYSNSSGTVAFSSASSGYAATPGGDPAFMINKNAGGSYCTTPADLLNIATVTTSTRDSTFESQGYKAYGMNASAAKGYSVGPGYYGKTFFLWPPDPTNDWRKLYFTFSGGTPDNSKLWDSGGNWQAPSASTYSINYAAILNWIQNVGPNPFPSSLQSGKIVYYTTIPSTIDTSTFPPADLNQRFWKDYIDFSLGLIQLTSSSWEVINDGSNGKGGYGPDFTFGTTKITAYSSLTGAPKPYMYYKDNPLRPRTHFWFGPLTMIDCIGSYNVWYDLPQYCSRFCWWPGTCHEAPMYACKLGIAAALSDMQNNQPNDYIAMSFFSVPQSSSNDTSGTRFNRPRVGLGQNFTNMQNSLWYPPAYVNGTATTVTPYDSDNLEIPRANGSTCYAFPLMMCYNQFSGNSTLVSYNAGAPSGDAGGSGRKGAQKIIIFETDGAPNTTAQANFYNGGAYNSYYNIRYNTNSPSGSEFPSSISQYANNDPTVTNQIYSLCTQLAAQDSASPAGYSTSSKPLLLHCLGFGPQFTPGASSYAANVATLNAMQVIGNVNDGMPSYKIIYGTQSQIVTALQQAFTQILQTGVQVALIQ